jgi:methylenetetrahydrofolate dehydrogenase (NADP+)/methenyltetrahydrofolate cyclohydrolase
MKYKILDGKKTAKLQRQKLRQEIKEKNLKPGLAVILVGDNQASKIYVNYKEKACKKVGIKTINHNLPENTEFSTLAELIEKLNRDSQVDGILLQLPLPSHLDEDKLLEMIDPDKDVDGFHPLNVGKLILGKETFVSATPLGIMNLLKAHDIKFKGKEAVVVGRSNIVGKPIAALLTAHDATVTICHSKTIELEKQIARAQILIVAVGKRGVVKPQWIPSGCVVVDVGTHRLDSGKVVGDLDFEEVSRKAAWITPVPGGIGPMTIASLLQNTVKAALNH